MHDAETDIFVVQEREGRTVSDHHAFADAVVKEFIGGHILFQDLHEYEVGSRLIDLYRVPGGEFFKHTRPLGSDQLLGF